jgi:hypothetical protein
VASRSSAARFLSWSGRTPSTSTCSFYHVRLHCYFVIELKTGKFKPEYAGKLNFYLSAADGLIRTPADGPTLGLLLCEGRNGAVVEYALRAIAKPIGVSTY